MNGWLIYDAEGARRNEWFINHLSKLAGGLGATLNFVSAEKLITEIQKGELAAQWSGAAEARPDFAVVRTICPQINKFFEDCGVPCFNNYKTAFVANDKWQTYLLAKKLGLPVMPTHLLSDFSTAREMVEGSGFPLVIKSRAGHGGIEVYAVNNQTELQNFLKNNNSSQYICQPMCSEPGIDVRVYMLGGKIIAAAERRSKKDFRSNYSLGGSAKIVQAEDLHKKIAEKLFKELDCDFVGIDFIKHRGGWVLNEAEDVVGTRMLYSLTQIDAAELYLRHIMRSILKIK